jgi:protein required for attachment to host cells
VANSIGAIVIAAPPHFSGLLRQAMSKQARELVLASVEKDYTKLSPAELQMRLAEHVSLKRPA